MDPPAQDSPNHILNALIDDCIDHIFRRIFNVQDYLNMAQACKRFQRRAQICFRTQFPSVGIFTLPETIRELRNEVIPSTRAVELLSTFGPSIQEVRLITTPNREHDDEIFNAVVKFCNNTLEGFHITARDRPCTIDFEQKFPALRKLELYHAPPMNFDQGHALETLSVGDMDPSGIIRAFPRLKRFDCADNDYEPYYITDDMICKFVMLNPQLEVLKLRSCSNVTPNILRAIGENSVSLATLFMTDFRVSPILNMNLPYLGLLTQLRFICIRFDTLDPFEIMVNTFAENKVPIEEIRLQLFFIADHSNDTCSDFKTIKTLKHFSLSVFDEDIDVFNANGLIFNLVRTQTALETMRILPNDIPVSMKTVRNVLAYGTKLTKFDLKIAILEELNLDIYESVLCFVKNRTRVRIMIDNRQSQCIPEDVPTDNEWLLVRYFCLKDDLSLKFYSHR